MKYLVYVWGAHGPSPQLWADDDVLMTNEGTEKPTLYKVTLSLEHMNLSIDELTKIYPFPVSC